MVDMIASSDALQQRVLALAAVSGVLLAALRRAGLMTADLNAVLLTELPDTAAAVSARVSSDWKLVIDAVEKVAIATNRDLSRNR